MGIGLGDIDEICSAYDNAPDALIEIMLDVQERLGWVAPDHISAIAKQLNLSRADVHGVASFYHDIRTEPGAKKALKFCRGEACQARGGRVVETALKDQLGLDYGEHSADGSIELEAVYCLGNCALGPAAEVDGSLHARLSAENLEDLLAGIKGNP